MPASCTVGVFVRVRGRHPTASLRSWSYLSYPSGGRRKGAGHGHARRVAGTSGPDILRGTNGAGKLLGKGVNDVLFGLGGRDDLLGGVGKDWVLRGNERLLLEGDKTWWEVPETMGL
jgi:Ca2+-binding RTX toxin-like protein